jgi:hypothetical protein
MRQIATEQALAGAFTPGPREIRPRPAEVRRPPVARLALVHGVYLLLSGSWPLLSPRTFARARGSRSQALLTKSVGICLANIGAALAAAGARGKVAREMRMLAVGVGLGFAAMDFLDAGIRRRASPFYIVDGAVQLAFAALWSAAELRDAAETRRPPEPAFA